MPKRTPENVCIEYTKWVVEVRRLKRWLNDRANFCEHYEPIERPEYNSSGIVYPGYEGVSKSKCLDEYDQQDPLPSDGLPSEQSAYFENNMCAKCKGRWDQRGYLRMSKDMLARAKRSIEAVGKRLNAEASR